MLFGATGITVIGLFITAIVINEGVRSLPRFLESWNKKKNNQEREKIAIEKERLENEKLKNENDLIKAQTENEHLKGI